MANGNSVPEKVAWIHPDHGPFRMICYTADHRGELTPSREIAETAWFRYDDRNRVSAVDEMAFDALHEAGRIF